VAACIHAAGAAFAHSELVGRTADDDTLHELLLAAWPRRTAGGAGNLDRLLEAAADGAGGRAPAP
jgi:hypothetical protein